MSGMGGRSNNVRYEFDANGVLMQINEDGIRTHVKFIYDVRGMANLQNHIASQANVQAQADPAIKTEEVEISLNNICQTPKSQTGHRPLERTDAFAVLPTTSNVRCGRERRDSVSTQSSGPLGINHWARHMPMLPRPCITQPGSGAPTEIIQDTDSEPLDYNLYAPGNAMPTKPPSVLSGMSTQTAPSFGHADANSGYFEYQEDGLRTFDCEDMGNNKRAQASIIIQRCDATERNLGVSKVPNYVRFSSVDTSSTDDDVRFVSPSPSGQFVPPSLYSREVTPMPTVDESFKDNAPPTPRASYDIVSGKWLHDCDMIFPSDSTTPTNSIVNPTIQAPSPVAELIDSEMTDPTHKVEATPGIAGGSVVVSGLFSRECSPLTEYDYSAMDAEEDSIKYRLRSRAKQLPISPVKVSARTKPTSARGGSKKLGGA